MKLNIVVQLLVHCELEYVSMTAEIVCFERHSDHLLGLEAGQLVSLHNCHRGHPCIHEKCTLCWKKHYASRMQSHA